MSYLTDSFVTSYDQVHEARSMTGRIRLSRKVASPYGDELIDPVIPKRTWLTTNYFHVLAPRQRNGSSREANPSSNEDDATGWGRHGKEAMSGESTEGNIARE